MEAYQLIAKIGTLFLYVVIHEKQRVSSVQQEDIAALGKKVADLRMKYEISCFQVPC